MRFVTTIAALAAATAILAAGAGSSVRAAKDACSLLTPEQVKAALGITVQKIIDSPRLCTWRGSAKDDSKQVALSILTANGFAMGKTPVPGVDKPAESGVGDEAYYQYYTGPEYEKIKLVDLQVKKGSAMFGVQVGGFPVSNAKALTKTLALEVLKSL
jgi:hypothetical protein